MQSSNPVFRKADGFNGRSQTSPASGMSYPAYGSTPAPARSGTYDPYQQGTGIDAMQGRAEGPMTIDSVVQKTGITLGLVVLAAAATWFLTPVPSAQSIGGLYALAMVGALVGFGLSMVNSFKRVVSPALVMAYAVVEGVFVGAFSKALEVAFTQPGQEPGGLVIGAVVGTMAAVAGTLAAYKFFNIQVGTKFRKWVIAAGMGFLAVTFLDVILGFFGNAIGLRGETTPCRAATLSSARRTASTGGRRPARRAG